ncbi:MAG TPA: thermonuclease family protein [Solirubrobacteraceae bacterium]|nr:thermonuclease family protein [Solirubrobacteraceae bacterium]
MILALTIVILGYTTADRPGRPNGSGQTASDASDTVVRVVDGDTVVLRSAGKSRLIGVDTPEVYGTPGCYGGAASAFAKRTLRPGMPVNVERDIEPRDRYRRSLVYLTLPDGRSFNEMLVEDGFAVPLTIAPNVRYAARFRELANRARREHAGLWSPETCDGQVNGSR